MIHIKSYKYIVKGLIFGHKVKQLLPLSKTQLKFLLLPLLQNKLLEAQTLNDNMAEEKNTYSALLEEEAASSRQNKARVNIHYILLPGKTQNLWNQTLMIRYCFLNRLRNWRSQMRSCSSAEKRSRKLSLRSNLLQYLLQFARL